MIKVYFDEKPLQLGHAIRGIGSYTKNLLNELEKSKEIELVENINLANVVHYPYFDFFFDTLNLMGNKKNIVTIYDTIPLIYPKSYPPGVRGKINFLKQKNKLKKVDAIITISETSKKDIVRYLDVESKKIFPIHLAPSANYKKLEITKRFGLPERFVLYVGDVNYNKNIYNLASACKMIGVNLVIVGKQASLNLAELPKHKENDAFRNFLEKYENDSLITRMGFVEEEELVQIYNLAVVYCQPSYYEGFGLPILEAMACGTPVIATKNQAHVEIAEDSCVFSGFNNVEIASALKTVLDNKKIQRELITNGLKKVKEYSWDKTARETIKVYKKFL